MALVRRPEAAVHVLSLVGLLDKGAVDRFRLHMVFVHAVNSPLNPRSISEFTHTLLHSPGNGRMFAVKSLR
jgi:hypothetical protein